MTLRTHLLALSTAVLALGAARNAQDLPTQRLTIFGGTGGSAFSRDCGPGRVMTGLRGREGMVVDAIGLLCSPVSSTGQLGPPSTIGSLAGGTGGDADDISCRTGQVVTGFRIHYGTYVDLVAIRCQPWNAATRSFSGTVDDVGAMGAASIMGGRTAESVCGSNKQPASGMRGRASGLVDAIGLECDEP